MSDLKPCPFCGGPAHARMVAEWNTYEVCCGRCGAVSKDACTRERAAEQWDTRAIQPEVTALAEALQNMISGYEEYDLIDDMPVLRPIEKQSSWIQRARAALTAWEAANG